MFDRDVFDVRSKKKIAPRVEFSVLLENGLLNPGQTLYFQKNKNRTAVIKPDARLRANDGFEGSIHQVGTHLMNGSPCNGWDHWYLKENDQLISLDTLRQRYLIESGLIK